MPLEYAAAAPPSGPVRKPDFRAGSLTKAFAGDFLEEVEPGRGASGARPAQSPVYASRAAGGKGAATDYKGCTTLFETFDRAVREFGDRPALGRRPVRVDDIPQGGGVRCGDRQRHGGPGAEAQGPRGRLRPELPRVDGCNAGCQPPGHALRAAVRHP